MNALKSASENEDTLLKVKRNAKGNSKRLINTIVPKFEYKNSKGEIVTPKAV